ncbi:MAG: type IX secretion system outer membrane channel protein PorV [Bacteroidota bacterium]
MLKKIYFVILFSFPLFAQVKTSAVPFLLIGPNSRMSGMGEAGTALADDASALFWNPAGLAQLTGTEVSITHSSWLPQFQMKDLFYSYLNYRKDLPDLGGTFATSITYLNLGEFIRTDETGPEEIERFKSFEYAITVGYGTKVTDALSLGLNARFINSRLAPFGAGQEKGSGIAYDWSFDLGLLYRPQNLIIPLIDLDLEDNFSLGMNLSNLGPTVTYIDEDQADPLPTNLRLGFGYQAEFDDYNMMNVVLDFSKLLVQSGKDLDGNGIIETDRERDYNDPFYKAIITSWMDDPKSEELRSIISSIGIEYWYGNPKLIALRAGYFYEDPDFGNRRFKTFGAGIRWDIYGFDFSYIATEEEKHPLSDTLRFTLSILWDAIKP